jgi:hypothetical protein
MKIFALIMGLLLMAGSAPIDIDGTWSGQYKQMGMGGMGDQIVTMTYEFKADGDTLTGTVIGAMGNRSPIQEGRISGKRIYFKIEVPWMESTMVSNYEGVVKGDYIEMRLNVKMPAGSGGGRFRGFGMGGASGPASRMGKSSGGPGTTKFIIAITL